MTGDGRPAKLVNASHSAHSLAQLHADRDLQSLSRPRRGWLAQGSMLASDLIRFTAYMFLAVLSWSASRRVRQPDRLILNLVSVIAVSFGIAILLGLAGTVADLGRQVAWDEGWYRQRRPVQAAVIVIIAFAAAIGIALLPFALGNVTVRARSLLALAFVLVAFVSVHTVSLHQLDAILNRSGPGNFRIGDAVEVTIVLACGLAALHVGAPRSASVKGGNGPYR